MIKDTGDKIGAGRSAGDRKGDGSLKKASEGTDAAAIDARMEQFTQAQHKAAEALYSGGCRRRRRGRATGGGASQGTRAAHPQARSAEDAEGDVIDAEVGRRGKEAVTIPSE